MFTYSFWPPTPCPCSREVLFFFFFILQSFLGVPCSKTSLPFSPCRSNSILCRCPCFAPFMVIFPCTVQFFSFLSTLLIGELHQLCAGFFCSGHFFLTLGFFFFGVGAIPQLFFFPFFKRLSFKLPLTVFFPPFSLFFAYLVFYGLSRLVQLLLVSKLCAIVLPSILFHPDALSSSHIRFPLLSHPRGRAAVPSLPDCYFYFLGPMASAANPPSFEVQSSIPVFW